MLSPLNNENIKKINDIMKKNLEENSPAEGNSLMDKIERNNEFHKESLESLEKIAESAKLQAESAKSIAGSASRQADSAKMIAENANKQSLSAKTRVNWSLIITFISCIGTLIANADKICTNTIKILSHLGVLK